MSTSTKLCVSLGFLLTLAACGGGGGSPTPDPVPAPALPSAPVAVTAAPANAQATLAWSPVVGATSYNVYTSTSSPVTNASAKTAVSTTTATLPGVNSAPVFVKVAAVGAGGEGPLSSEVCAVPTAASTAGLSLYDSLCASTLDLAKWRSPLFSRTVSNGAMVLRTEAANTESFSSRGLAYATAAFVTAGVQRVTTLKADVTVPAALAARSGGADILAGLVLQYQPPSDRLGNDIGGALNVVRAQVGLIDSGSGLRVTRLINHCDSGLCSPLSSSGVAFTDPGGFDANGEAAAAYDTTYTLSISFNETTGAFAWSVAGGAFGSGVGGTVDPSAYLAGNPAWNALAPNPLAAGGGFQNAALRTRVLDHSSSGGSSAAITGRFDNVRVGFDNGAAVLWDDFSGSGANSGPTQLSAAKWTLGDTSMASTSGSIAEHLQMTSTSSAGFGYAQFLRVSDPASVQSLQTDVTVSSCANDASGGSNRVQLEANLYNDGSAGTSAPNTNQPYSEVGDVRAYLMLDCVDQTARFELIRWNSTSPLFGTLLSDSTNNLVPMGSSPIVGNTHTLALKWDPSAHVVTFQVDGQTPVAVNPTTVSARITQAAPYAKPANTPLLSIGGYIVVPASASAAGKAGTLDFRLNNVFTAP